MHNYQPRGIIKWAPFNALSKYEQEIQELFDTLDQVDYSKDSQRLDYISDTLYKALNSQEEITIQFVEQDILIEVEVIVKEITSEYVITENEQIKVMNIYDLF